MLEYSIRVGLIIQNSLVCHNRIITYSFITNKIRVKYINRTLIKKRYQSQQSRVHVYIVYTRQNFINSVVLCMNQLLISLYACMIVKSYYIQGLQSDCSPFPKSPGRTAVPRYSFSHQISFHPLERLCIDFRQTFLYNCQISK